MTIATSTTIRLDPVLEHEVVQQYKNDKNWIEYSETTTAVVFKYIWPAYNIKATYFDMSKEGDHEHVQ